MKFIKRLTIFCILSLSLSVQAEKITIAAASDLKFAMDEIIASFKKSNPGNEVDVVYGSSGKFQAQIREGAPFDIYFSADINYPRELAKSGFASSEVIPYAIGRIVLWSANQDASKMTLNNLLDSKVVRIAIANPKHAPYGKRAEEALHSAGLWEKVESKLVFGENIAQTAQFVQTGNAQVGIIALSLAISPELAGKGGYFLIPDNLHQPLEQGFIVTKRASKNPLAKKFAEYVMGEAVRTVMAKYGFALPSESSDK
ncbi:molybdate ABC transporter, periplasmic molybdate-binding protein [Leptospira fainei serovar Hurstbridge str. BUT 6]|uniref:Molybdate ABC transporter, periplasmic molybdate-binding protein n=1 Tax=Leptospira fainei serovar Hurstbridge str. BUT 6 TaxID=1193011 RepID=S3VWT6_9LEPT|nr:molybdate ABC transporter substrate-binding protein [Leptospira fainei]EPG72582.1 molybdate ABC transporter, periplasmic molybdate-binding protein [Leptospira fainei serovar Hurstbridge str. BUT 6]